MEWLKAVWDLFGKLFSPSTQKAICNGVRRAAPYVSYALEMVRLGAEFTSSARTCGTVLRFADALGVYPILRTDATDEELGSAMRDIVARALRMKFPDAKLSVLNLAIEIAVGSLKR